MTSEYAPRNIGKKIALISAVGSLLCGFFSLGATLWYWQNGGPQIITGSLGATTFFFVTAAIVLYEMSRPRFVFDDEKAGNGQSAD